MDITNWQNLGKVVKEVVEPTREKPDLVIESDSEDDFIGGNNQQNPMYVPPEEIVEMRELFTEDK